MNRKELHAYAVVHLDTPGVPHVLSAIQEAKVQMDHALSTLDQSVFVGRAHMKAENYETLDNVGTYALKYEQGAAKLNTLFLTLACLLEAAGHKVEY